MGSTKTLVLVEDKPSERFVAYYNEIPYAMSQGRSKEEAIKLLDELIYFIEAKEDLTSL